MKTTRAFLPLLLAGMLCAVAGALSAPATAPLPKESVYQLPLTLVDQHGHASDWQAHRGKAQVVAMFYTSCQFTCPLIVDSGKAIDHALTPAERARLGVLLVSMDPARDTPAKLMSVVKQRGLDTSRWSLASPRDDAVRSVAGVLGVRYRRLANGDFNHTSGLLLLDRDGRIVARTEQVGSIPDPEFLAAVRELVGPSRPL